MKVEGNIFTIYYRSFLKDLVETTHLFLRMIENFTKGNRHLVVQRKKRKIKRKKQSRGTSMELYGKHACD